MADDTNVKSSEQVVRALVRLPSELETRPPKDENDFLRRRDYRRTGKPENGISLFRKEKFASNQDIWDRLGMANPVGSAECEFKKVEEKGLQYKVSGKELEHISLRCPDCDLSELPAVCKPKWAKDHNECPFFDVDTFDLNAVFDLIEKPMKRNLTAKQKERN